MPRFIAFLRAVNVGGRVVTMERLKSLFVELGLTDVETFIASGNVIFQSRSTAEAALQRKIEKHLQTSLGYEVPTMLRSDAEVAAVATYQPFTTAKLKAATTLNVGFLSAPLDSLRQKAVIKFNTDIDDFHVAGREVYWLCRIRQSESKFNGNVFERAIGTPATFRNINTVQRLTAKYPPAIPSVKRGNK